MTLHCLPVSAHRALCFREKRTSGSIMKIRSLLATAALAIFVPNSVLADPVGDFYKGKQIRFIIRAAPGGNYDIYLRLLARHIVRHIPGSPDALPVNMPGGGGLTALNHTVTVAP